MNYEEPGVVSIAPDPAELARIEAKIDEVLALLHRAEPLLSVAEGWSRLRGGFRR